MFRTRTLTEERKTLGISWPRIVDRVPAAAADPVAERGEEKLFPPSADSVLIPKRRTQRNRELDLASFSVTDT